MRTLEYLQDPWARHAVLAAVAVGTICSLLSVIVVLKRLAFVGEGIAHAGFGGVGTAIFLGFLGGQALPNWAHWLPDGAGPWALDTIIFAFCLATALGIGALSRHRHVEPDSAIGLFLVGAMAWGVLMQNLRTHLLTVSPVYRQWFFVSGRAPSYEQLLFGSLTLVTGRDAWLALAVAAGVLLIGAGFLKETLFYVFDEAASRVFGVRTGLIHYLLLLLLSVTIVVGVRLAGFILIGALLVIPGATAVMLSRRLGRVFLAAWALGMLGVVGGLVVSFEVGRFSSGPCIVGVLCLIFATVFVGKAVMKRVGA